jgi:hypothetical protein
VTSLARFALASAGVLAFDVVWPLAYGGFSGARWWLDGVLTIASLAIAFGVGFAYAPHVPAGAAVAWTAGVGLVDATLGWALSLWLLPEPLARERAPAGPASVVVTLVGVVAVYALLGLIGAAAGRRWIRAR